MTEVIRFGPVPGLKASSMAASPSKALTPELGLIQAVVMPGGTLKGVAGLPSSAFCMNSVKIGVANVPPVTEEPMERGWS
ncbi:hypothetical protein D3C71_1769880 [compost metagenome]